MRASSTFDDGMQFEEIDDSCVARLVAEVAEGDEPVVGPRTALIFVDFGAEPDTLLALQALDRRIVPARARCACVDTIDEDGVVMSMWRWDVTVDAEPNISFTLMGVSNLEQADLLQEAALVVLSAADPEDAMAGGDPFLVALPAASLRWMEGPLTHRPA